MLSAEPTPCKLNPPVKSSALTPAPSLLRGGVGFIFLEIVTILSQRRSRRVAIETGEYLLANPNVEIIHIGPVLQTSSWQIFKEIANKNVSFVDCSTIAVMKAEGIRHLLTLDLQDFKPLSKKYRFGLYDIS